MAAIGRNDACPCGSGRKVKKCHDGNWPEGDLPGAGDDGGQAEAEFRKVALHEAGHAVACALLGRQFEEVSLATMTDRVSTASGPAEMTSILGVRFSDAVEHDRMSSYRAGRLDARDLVIALAGGAAVSILAKGSVDDVKQGMWWDFQNIGYAITGALEGIGDERADNKFVRAVLAAALERAGAFVESNRDAILLVAAELRTKKSLSFGEVQALVGREI